MFHNMCKKQWGMTMINYGASTFKRSIVVNPLVTCHYCMVDDLNQISLKIIVLRKNDLLEVVIQRRLNNPFTFSYYHFLIWKTWSLICSTCLHLFIQHLATFYFWMNCRNDKICWYAFSQAYSMSQIIETDWF